MSDELVYEIAYFNLNEGTTDEDAQEWALDGHGPLGVSW